MSVRTRIRRDDPKPEPDGVRRILIQSKVGSAVDENGMKSAAKMDIRKDVPSAADIDGLDESIRSGKSDWGWGMNRPKEPIAAIAEVYHGLRDVGALEDIGEHKDVLLLEAKSHVRSTRSRFHLNESSRSSTLELFQKAGEPKIREALDIVRNSEFSGPEADRLLRLGEGIADKSLFIERCKERLIALDPSLAQNGVNIDTIRNLWPDKPITSDKLETAKREVLANTIKEAHDEFATLLNEHRRDIAGSRGREHRDFAIDTELINFFKERHPELKSAQTIAPFLQKYDSTISGTDKDKFIEDFGKWAAEKGKPHLAQATNKDAALDSIRKHLVNSHLQIVGRQIEASGTMAQTLSFDNMRKAYANNERGYGNFIIDTFDLSEFYTPEIWNSLTPEERAGAKPIDPQKMYHAMVVNEVQIELGYEKPFVAAIDKAKSNLAQAKAEVFAEYATANGLSVRTGEPETFHRSLQEILQKPEAERDAILSELQAFADAKGSPLSFQSTDLKDIQQGSFSSHIPLGIDSHRQLLEDLRMSKFIWSELRTSQEFISDLRGDRVKSEAKRANMEVSWENTEMSKGDLSLHILREKGL
jgi:hypothetical protein